MVSDRPSILKIFRQFLGSFSWAAREIGVRHQTVSAWLLGKKASKRLDREMPPLAQKLLDTDGKCIRELDGSIAATVAVRLKRLANLLDAEKNPSVRSQVAKIRAKDKGKRK